MAEGEGARRGDPTENSAGSAFVPLMMMEDLLDKLKLLNYDSAFCAAYGIRPFCKHHFALPADSSHNQFYHFASLVTWMMSLLGRNLEQVQEYDDPNATVSTIITALKAGGIPVNFPPGRLKQGHGEYVLQVLDSLAEMALKSASWSWGVPRHPDESGAGGGEADADEMDEEMEDETAEVKTGQGSEFDEIADETAFVEGSDDDDDDEGLSLTGIKTSLMDDATVVVPKEALISKADANEWKLEVERVLPTLRVQIRADDKDWRVRKQQIGKHESSIDSQLSDTKQQLTKLHDDVNKALEKITSREKYINAQLSVQLADYRKLNDTCAETTSRYNGSSGGVTDLTSRLASLTDELDGIKSEMDEYGASMADAAPLVRLKQSLTRLKMDVVDAEMRCGVMEHILVTAAMKQKNALQRDLNIERPSLTSTNRYGEFNTV